MLLRAAQLICNSFTICNAEMQEVGVGLYPSMSLLNHSCDPNCSIVFNGPHLLLRAVRDIQAGEELTICYLDMLMTSAERRQQLRDQYCFDCDCARCLTQDKDADMLTGDEKVWKEVQESLKKIEELKAQWSILFAVCSVNAPFEQPVRSGDDFIAPDLGHTVTLTLEETVSTFQFHPKPLLPQLPGSAVIFHSGEVLL
ncbi:histone-lysine N-methyltransferase SMYD3-like [Myotis lucifugus]|uniref:histone-lysine N-methyltransferase SMYD3-like n=1 Tax=Myotis lucifugus TaxID=59463 RepID=UPI0003C48755|nr:histone-lysine N-methyltransferase SMYD3-like [Myotis lucifugus]